MRTLSFPTLALAFIGLAAFVPHAQSAGGRIAPFLGEFRPVGRCQATSARVTGSDNGRLAVAVTLFARTAFEGMPLSSAGYQDGNRVPVGRHDSWLSTVRINGGRLEAVTRSTTGAKEVISRSALKLQGSGLQITWRGGSCLFQRVGGMASNASQGDAAAYQTASLDEEIAPSLAPASAPARTEGSAERNGTLEAN